MFLIKLINKTKDNNNSSNSDPNELDFFLSIDYYNKSIIRTHAFSPVRLN